MPFLVFSLFIRFSDLSAPLFADNSYIATKGHRRWICAWEPMVAHVTRDPTATHRINVRTPMVVE